MITNYLQYIKENAEYFKDFYHGGNLDDLKDDLNHKSGRFEYGSGLYVVDNLNVALKYARGNRKLYKLDIEKGVDISEVLIDKKDIYEFVFDNVIYRKRKEILDRINKYIKDDDKIKANIFNNIMLNEKAITSTKTNKLRIFLLEHGIDYEIIDNAFGFGEQMIVLYNFKKLKNVSRFKF
jgi:hypothetical protein